jgi:hypothetical protein
MKMKRGLLFLTILAVAATLLAGCALPGSPTPGPSTQPANSGPSTGTLTVFVTDAPSYTVTSVVVHFSEVWVHKASEGEDGEGEWIQLNITGGMLENGSFDLAELRDVGETAELAAADLVAGKYTQLRVIMDEVAGVQVGYDENPNQEPVNAKLPSGELKFVRSFTVEQDGSTDIVLDFDLQKSVVFTGSKKNINVIVKPVVKLSVSEKGKPTELEATLESDTEAGAELSADQAYTGKDSAHLETLGDPGSGDEARIVVPVPEGTTLADIAAVSWWEYLVTGYPPHLDIMLDIDGDGTIDDSLVFEYAYNDVALHYLEGPMPYNALTGDWYQTFSDDGNGPAQVDDTAYGWLSSGPPGAPGDPTFISGTLADWKSGLVNTAIDGMTSVVSLEIEIDNWVVQSEAYIDDIVIVIGGITYTVVFDLD